MVYTMFARGKGIFRILFTIDDFLRLVAMSIIMFLLFKDSPRLVFYLMMSLGIIIDLHDLWNAIVERKPIDLGIFSG